ncbi:hypothetical protein HZS_6144, partial [Henneguya salminicola]
MPSDLDQARTSDSAGKSADNSAFQSNTISTKQIKTPDCRDFLRGRCSRHNCKYNHPAGAEIQKFRDSDPKIRNRDRISHNHSYESSEHDFNRSRDFISFPNAGMRENQMHHPYMDPSSYGWDTRQICFDFMNGYCRRGNNCTFKHIEEPGAYEYYKNPSSAFRDSSTLSGTPNIGNEMNSIPPPGPHHTARHSFHPYALPEYK